MDNLPGYYTVLYNAVTDALAEMDNLNFGRAIEILVKGQQTAEELYMTLVDGEK